ncbi:hypothetical protein SDC9_54640 [bioreactor metagenome]|uniref:Uncharacterized protein n=1 Tax=bioreactor metagenome TaxID=1076179 RepID=A0A644WXV9_9ZZZZ
MACKSIADNSCQFIKSGINRPALADKTGMVFILLGIVVVILLLLIVVFCAVLSRHPGSRALINV